MKLKQFTKIIVTTLMLFQITLLLPFVHTNAVAANDKITFYIDSQINPDHIDEIRLVKGYVDHPSLPNLINGNTVTIPEGRYLLSVTLKEGYEFDTSHGGYNVYPKSNPNATYKDVFGISRVDHQYFNLFYIDASCQGDTLIISGKTQIDYRPNNEITEDEFYRLFPEYKNENKRISYTYDHAGKEFGIELFKNGTVLTPNDKFKIGDKVQFLIHNYDDNIFYTIVKLANVPGIYVRDIYFDYNDQGELYAERTITIYDIGANKYYEPNNKIDFYAPWASYMDFARSETKVNLTTQSETGGNFTVYKVTLNKNNEEILTKVDNGTRLVPGNRLKLFPKATTGWEFTNWNVTGGIITSKNYFVITDDNVSISANFNKIHDINLADADINNDGAFNISDITTLLRLYTNGNTNLLKHDFNKDGKVDISDITAMLRAYVNR